MQIVGKQGGNYLIVASELEIAEMMGFDSVYSEGWKSVLNQAKSRCRYNEPYTLEGMSISVLSLGEKVRAIRSQQHKTENAIKIMRDLADALEKAWPALVPTIGESA